MHQRILFEGKVHKRTCTGLRRFFVTSIDEPTWVAPEASLREHLNGPKT